MLVITERRTYVSPHPPRLAVWNMACVRASHKPQPVHHLPSPLIALFIHCCVVESLNRVRLFDTPYKIKFFKKSELTYEGAVLIVKPMHMQGTHSEGKG